MKQPSLITHPSLLSSQVVGIFFSLAEMSTGERFYHKPVLRLEYFSNKMLLLLFCCSDMCDIFAHSHNTDVLGFDSCTADCVRNIHIIVLISRERVLIIKK